MWSVVCNSVFYIQRVRYRPALSRSRPSWRWSAGAGTRCAPAGSADTRPPTPREAPLRTSECAPARRRLRDSLFLCCAHLWVRWRLCLQRCELRSCWHLQVLFPTWREWQMLLTNSSQRHTKTNSFFSEFDKLGEQVWITTLCQWCLKIPFSGENAASPSPPQNPRSLFLLHHSVKPLAATIQAVMLRVG